MLSRMYPESWDGMPSTSILEVDLVQFRNDTLATRLRDLWSLLVF
jgi:hypothetical protein